MPPIALPPAGCTSTGDWHDARPWLGVSLVSCADRIPRDDDHGALGQVQDLEGDAAERNVRQVRAPGRAKDDDVRVVLVGRMDDSPGDLTDMRLADLDLRADASVGKTAADVGKQALG